jgi:glycosyltransferase involved in cell wall biosynthesis
MNEFVSVLMPVKDTSSHLLIASIESILNQTHSNFEFLIVDDGNTESEILYILSDYNKKDMRIRVLTKKHTNLSSAFNYGLSFTEYRKVVHMGSDDFAYPDLIEKQLLYWENKEKICISGVQMVIKQNGLEDTITEHPEIVTREIATTMGCWITNHPGLIFDKNVAYKLGAYGFVENNFTVDYPLWVRFLLDGNDIYNLPDILINYTSSPDSYSGKNKGNEENNKWLEEWRMKL